MRALPHAFLLLAVLVPPALAYKNCTASQLSCKPSCNPPKDNLGNQQLLLKKLCRQCKCKTCERCMANLEHDPARDVLQHHTTYHKPIAKHIAKKTVKAAKKVTSKKPEAKKPRAKKQKPLKKRKGKKVASSGNATATATSKRPPPPRRAAAASHSGLPTAIEAAVQRYADAFGIGLVVVSLAGAALAGRLHRALGARSGGGP